MSGLVAAQAVKDTSYWIIGLGILTAIAFTLWLISFPNTSGETTDCTANGTDTSGTGNSGDTADTGNSGDTGNTGGGS